MSRRILVSIVIFSMMLLLLTSCRMGENEASIGQIESEDPDKLVVYISGPPHGFQSKEDPTGENIEYYYPSKYVVGMSLIGGELESLGGNIFHQALMEYSDITGIGIEVHYIEEYLGDTDIFRELYRKNQLPDLVLFTKHSQYDYYHWAKEEILLDFSQFTEDELYDEDLYYQEVLQGGVVEQKQIILPVLFNLNGLITTESFLDEIDADIDEEDILTYDDVLSVLEKSCIEMSMEQKKEAIFEASGLMMAGTYIPSILTGAAYPSYFENSSSDIGITTDHLARVLELMLLYNQQEFGVNPDWDEMTYEENKLSSGIMSRSLSSLSTGMHEFVGIFLSGGRSGGGIFHNSLLMDAVYFDSVYKDTEEEVVFTGIPTIENPNEYSANISVFAAGFSSTKYPKQVYDLARYLMDYEYPSAYGFSVNKTNTEEQLQSVGKTTTALYSDSIWSAVTGGFKTEDEIKSEIVILEPAKEKTVETIRHMLNNIAGAGLPYGPLEYILYNKALSYTANENMTCRETSAWMIQTIEEYIAESNDIEPFEENVYLQIYMNDIRCMVQIK